MEYLFTIFAIVLFATSVMAQSAVTLREGQRQQLDASKSVGSNANWTSSDPAVVSVINSSVPTRNGIVIARRPGTATITAAQGLKHSDTTVTVTDK